MKRYIYTLLIILSYISAARGQTSMSMPLDIGGTGNKAFNFDDIQDSSNSKFSSNNGFAGGKEGNDIYYSFTITEPMRIIAKTCGSGVSDTYLTLYSMTGMGLVAANDDYSGVGKCSNSLHSYIEKNVPPGTYLVIAEGKTKYNNGLIQTHISGTLLTTGGYSFNSAQEYSTKSSNFLISDANGTTGRTNLYNGKGLGEMYYKFTISVPMDIMVSHCDSPIDTYLSILDASKKLLYSNDDYSGIGACSNTTKACVRINKLPAGTYYVVSEGSDSQGTIVTRIEGTLPIAGDSFNPINIGSLNSNFNYTNTQNSTNQINKYQGKATNVVFHKITLIEPMSLILSHCGSQVSDTYLSVMDAATGQILYSNDNYTGSGACSNTQQAYINVDNLPAGTYYILSEGVSQNGSITLNINGARLYGGLNGNSDKNYIVSVSPLIAVASADRLTSSQSIQSVKYFDGLGRPIQTIQRGITPLKNDLVTYQEYDALGRESNDWLPGGLAATNNGAFVTLDKVIAASKTTNANNGTADQNPYSKNLYEASPLNRILEKYGSGADWHNATNNRAVRSGYLTNKAKTGTIAALADSLVCGLYVSADDKKVVSISKAKNYDAGELYVTRLKDEDNNISYEFKDKLGRVVLSRQINNGALHDTYYVYDNYGNLRVVLPPLATDKVAGSATWTDTNVDLQQYAYLYKYDSRNRCIYKKLPGCDPISYVYDKADRLIFTQDGVQRTKNEWSFTIPDVFDRTILTGVCANTIKIGTATAATTIAPGCLDAYLVKSDWAKATNTNKGYTITGITLTTPTVLTVNYYDNYDFMGLNGIAAATDANFKYEAISGYGVQYTGGYKGLLTGTMTALLNGSASPTYLYTAMYYDNRGRLIQTKSTNHLGGVEKEYIAYNFTGKSIQKQHVHTAPSKTTQTEVYKYTYDHAGRLTATTHQLNTGTAVTLAANTYDELGRLKTIVRNNQSNLTNSANTYNVRSWLTASRDYHFNEDLTYTFGGNVKTMSWTQHGQKRTYTFGYDNLSQVTSAAYTGATNEKYGTTYTYDKHGNMVKLTREGKLDAGTAATSFGTVDNLTLAYTGNQLTKVTDAGVNVIIKESADFKDVTGGKGAYTYNKNGALATDSHKGILGIGYNFLNLPQEIAVKNQSTTGKIYYTYSATGAKLKAYYLSSSNLSLNPVQGSTATDGSFENKQTTDYVGNIIYENGTLKRILVDGGYIEGGVYYFYLTDHLGNNRAVAKADGTVIQRTQYYPFGSAFADAPLTEQSKQPYKYNGKELEQMHGLNMYDYSARYMEPAIGRFTTVDPKAEKYYSISSYVYAGNNPMKFVDKDGKAYDYPPGMFGFGSPEQLRSQVIANEVEKLQIQAAKPAALNISMTIGGGNPILLGVGVTFTATYFLKGPDQGTGTLYMTPSLGAATPSVGMSIGASMTHVYGDERNFNRNALTGKSDDYSISYRSVGVTHSRMKTDQGDQIRSNGISLELNGSSLGKWNTSVNGSASKGYTFDLKYIFSGQYKKEKKENLNNVAMPIESVNNYYINRYTNLPMEKSTK